MAKPKPRKRGRPKREPFSPAELKAKAREGMLNSQHRLRAINTVDLAELAEEVDELSQYKKYSVKDIQELRDKVHAVYDDYIQRLEIEEEQVQAELKRNLPQLTLDAGKQVPSKPITEAEWNELHGLRADGTKKRGPLPKKKKLVWELEPGEKGTAVEKAEPVDLDALEKAHEQAMFEREIQRQREMPQPCVGKRLRKDHLNTKPRVDQSKLYY